MAFGQECIIRMRWVQAIGVGLLTTLVGWAQPTLAPGSTSASPMLWQQPGAGGGFTVPPTPNPLLFNFSVNGPSDTTLTWAEGTPGGAQFTFRLLDPSGTPIAQNASRANAPIGQYTLEITYDTSAGEPGAISSHTGNAWVRLNSSAGAASALYQVASRRGTPPAPPPAPVGPSWIGYLKGTLKRPPVVVYLEQRMEFRRGRTPSGGARFSSS